MSKKRSAPDEALALAPSRDELMDSLPYIDAPNEDYEEYALALIEAEMKTMKPPKLEEVPPIRFRTVAMENEYRRFMESDGKPEPMKLSLLKASAPSQSESLEEWKEAVNSARAEYESERLNSITLEAKKDAGAALLWKGFNGNLDQDLQAVSDALKRQREAVERINLERSEGQQKVGQQLQVLTHQYQEALQRRFQLHQATAALEHEVSGLS